MKDLIKSIQISDVAQAEEILKSAGTEDLFEKAKWNVGDTKVYQGITYEVGGFNAKGTPLWRKKKDGGSGNSSKTAKTEDGNARTRSKRNDIIEVGKIYVGKFDGDTVEYEVKEKRDGGYQLISYTYSNKDEDEFGNPKQYIDIQEETKTLDDMVNKIKKEKYFSFDLNNASESNDKVGKDNSDISFKSSKEIAKFIAKKFGTKVKRIKESVRMKNWHGIYWNGNHRVDNAHSFVRDCYEVQIDNAHKIRIGIVNSVTKDWMNCRKGEILMETAIKNFSPSGKRGTFEWNNDALTSYKQGSNFKDYLEKENVGPYQKEIGKRLYSEEK